MDDILAAKIINEECGKAAMHQNERGDLIWKIPLKGSSIPEKVHNALRHFGAGSAMVGGGKCDAEVHLTFGGKEEVSVQRLVDAGLKIEGTEQYLERDRDKDLENVKNWLIKQSNTFFNPIGIQISQMSGKDSIGFSFSFNQTEFDRLYPGQPDALQDLKRLLVTCGSDSVSHTTDRYENQETGGEIVKHNLSSSMKLGNNIYLDPLKLSEMGIKIPGMELIKSAFVVPEKRADQKPSLEGNPQAPDAKKVAGAEQVRKLD